MRAEGHAPEPGTFGVGRRLWDHFEGTVVQDLLPSDIAEYKAARRNDGVSDATIHKDLATLRAALRYCQHEPGWSVPADLLRGRLPKPKKRGMRWLIECA